MQGTITNQVGGEVVAATDRILVVTNAPWLFQGDSVRITTSATNAFSVVGTGVTGEEGVSDAVYALRSIGSCFPFD